MTTLLLRDATLADAPALADIYNPYVLETAITYEIDPISVQQMAARVAEKQRGHAWLVAEDDGRIMGYAYYGRFRERAAYDHVVESTIYLARGAQRKGIGAQLYRALLERCRAAGYREAIGVIALPNPASVALHEKMGFAHVGVLVRTGYKFGHYIDTGLWQKSLG